MRAWFLCCLIALHLGQELGSVCCLQGPVGLCLLACQQYSSCCGCSLHIFSLLGQQPCALQHNCRLKRRLHTMHDWNLWIFGCGQHQPHSADLQQNYKLLPLCSHLCSRACSTVTVLSCEGTHTLSEFKLGTSTNKQAGLAPCKQLFADSLFRQMSAGTVTPGRWALCQVDAGLSLSC